MMARMFTLVKAASCYIAAMDDDQIIAQRISGKSVRAIAKAQGCSAAEINHVIDAWAESAIDDKIRKHSLVLELARLDELQQVFYRRAIDDGDVQSGMLVTKIIERRCVMLGLSTPQQAVLQIVDSSTPKQPSTTERIERAINDLITQRPPDKDDPTTH